MTIAISMKVNDGIVLATDSAATIAAESISENTYKVAKIYYNAEKLFNLFKGHPIGVITWGTGSIGKSSISTIIKDFRKNYSEQIKENDYSIESIALKLSEFVYNVHFKDTYKNWKVKPPHIGFMVSGYSKAKDFGEEWKFDIINGELTEPYKIRGENQSGITWNGEHEAIFRMIKGYSSKLPSLLNSLEIDSKIHDKILTEADKQLTTPFILAPMPIHDAIDLANFLVDTTINFFKFAPGAEVVGGPIDIAVITKHEGFKWIKRKYYYDSELNPC